MKAGIITSAFFAVGTLLAAAQSNPSSTNGVDAEMPMQWPDGNVYVSAYNAPGDYESTDDPLGPYEYWIYNWSETGGGTGQYGGPGFGTNNFTWPGVTWPQIGYGVSVNAQSGATNNTEENPPLGFYIFGSVDFTYVPPTDPSDLVRFQYNDQPQVTLVTGGMPGTTGNELYNISYNAQALWPNDYTVPSQNINVSSMGRLNTNAQLFAVLPLHTQIPITPSANAGWYSATPSVQPYQLVSQCAATIPPNQSRTTIGVGEQVNLSFSPSLPINAVWKTTAGSLSAITNTSTQFTAPSNATSATVTATIAGQPPVGISFNVVAPSGIDHAVIVNDYSNADNWYSASYMPGDAGAGMDLNVYIAPTNVSFYRVCIMEVPGPASNITGYFTTNSVPPHGTDQGAGEWTDHLGYDNHFQDTAASFLPGLPPPWVAGGFDWVIPSEWQIQGSSVTNNFTQWTESFRLLDANGDFSTSKFGQTVTRTTNDVVTP